MNPVYENATFIVISARINVIYLVYVDRLHYDDQCLLQLNWQSVVGFLSDCVHMYLCECVSVCVFERDSVVSVLGREEVGRWATQWGFVVALQWGEIEFGLSAELISSVWPETRSLTDMKDEPMLK